jgi:hypothetical protein
LDFSNEPPAPAPPPALPAPPVQDAHTIVSYQGDTRQYPGAPPTTSYDNMSFTSAPPAYGTQPPPPQQQQYAVPQIQNGPPPQQYAPQPPPAQDQFAPPPTSTSTYDQFAPQLDDPFAPKPPPPPSREDVTSAVRIYMKRRSSCLKRLNTDFFIFYYRFLVHTLLPAASSNN